MSEEEVLHFSLPHCAYLMDYHWDHLHFLLIILSCTDFDSSPLSVVTHTSSIWLMTHTSVAMA
jgi:hypothetical protein